MKPLAAAALAVVLATLASPAMATDIKLTNGPDQYELKKPGATVHGLKGDDRLLAVDIKATLIGDAGNDILIGRNFNKGKSVLVGGDGNDNLFCDGTCEASGGPSDDHLSAESSLNRSLSVGDLYGGPGRDTFTLNCVTAHRWGCNLSVWDMTTADKLKIIIPNGDTGKATNLLDIFDIFDANHDGLISSADNGYGATWTGWNLEGTPADTANHLPGSVKFSTDSGEGDDFFYYVRGVAYLTKAMLVR